MKSTTLKRSSQEEKAQRNKVQQWKAPMLDWTSQEEKAQRNKVQYVNSGSKHTYVKWRENVKSKYDRKNNNIK